MLRVRTGNVHSAAALYTRRMQGQEEKRRKRGDEKKALESAQNAVLGMCFWKSFSKSHDYPDDLSSVIRSDEKKYRYVTVVLRNKKAARRPLSGSRE